MKKPSSKFYKNIEKGTTTPGCIMGKSLQPKGKVIWFQKNYLVCGYLQSRQMTYLKLKMSLVYLRNKTRKAINES